MIVKRTFQLMVVVAVLAASFVQASGALAGGNCASYITVQWGDTLSGIAAYCGTTMEAIQSANPGLGWWVYAGQVLYIPTGYSSAPVYAPKSGGSYTIQWGDTLGNIAASKGVSLSDLLAVNPQIWNVNLIYPGQAINLPANAGAAAPVYYPPAPPAPAATAPVEPYKTLVVTYEHGLVVRTGAGKDYPAIESRYVSALYNTSWKYRTNSITVDSSGFVWVEVTLPPQAPYSTGWMLVRDTLGQYYTDLHVNP